MEIMERLSDLAFAASEAGFQACTEKQALYICDLMARRNISVNLFKSDTMLTKQGASNMIRQIPLMNRGLV